MNLDAAWIVEQINEAIVYVSSRSGRRIRGVYLSAALFDRLVAGLALPNAPVPDVHLLGYRVLRVPNMASRWAFVRPERGSSYHLPIDPGRPHLPGDVTYLPG